MRFLLPLRGASLNGARFRWSRLRLRLLALLEGEGGLELPGA